MKRASGTASRRDLARVWTARAWWRAWRGVARGLAWRRRPAAPRSSLVAWHAAWTCETGSQRSVPAPCAAQSARRSRGGGSGRPTSSINSNKFFGRGRKNGTVFALELRLLADGLRQLLRSYALFEWHTRTTTIADIHKRAPAPLGTALTRRFQCSCTVARQGQSAAQPWVCLHHLAGVGVNALAGHQASRRVGAVRSAEEQDVRLRPGGGRCGASSERVCDQMAHATRERWMRQGMMAPVDGIVHPPAALLHAYAAPLRIIQQPPLGCSLGNVLGQDDVTAQHAERERVS